MLRRWQVDDGHQVGSAIQTGCHVYATALSNDRKWLACGLTSQPYARVWDAETHTKVLDITGHASPVLSVDISSNSTTFATGGLDKRAFIWTTTGERLVGPLQHDSNVVAVRFSPDGRRLATAAAGKSIRIFNSDDGRQLLAIPCSFEQIVSSPLAWSADSCQIFAASQPSNEAKCFDTSSGSLLSTWPLPTSSSSRRLSSIAPSSNQKFIAVIKNTSLYFQDALTHKQIGPVINHASDVYSMTLSSDSAYVVTGEEGGKVTVRSLRGVLPDTYLTGDVSVSAVKR
jgi:WD40 repeat protein